VEECKELWRRGNQGRWKRGDNTVIKIQNYCRIMLVGHRKEGSRVSGRRDGFTWIVVGETLQVQSVELEGLISIRGDIDVHGTFEIIFFLLLTVYRPRKTPNIPMPLSSRSSRIVVSVCQSMPCKDTSKSSSYKEGGTSGTGCLKHILL